MKKQPIPTAMGDTNAGSAFKDLKAGHLAIRTSEYEALIKWYGEKLDFSLIHEWTVGDMQLAFMALPNDSTFLIEILGIKDPKPVNTLEGNLGYDHLCFHVENLDETLQELNKRGVPVIRSFSVPAIGKRVAFIADPFGHKIEFCEDLKQRAITL